jgi:uncharacterized protein YndB with AHSA1/START domain
MAKTSAPSDTPGRIFSTAIDIKASPEDVWRALTEASELVRWFPLQARVTPGPGGKMFWGWDTNWAWESDIAIWEPGRRLRLVEHRPAFDVGGKPVPGSPQLLAMEFTIEPRDDGATIRIVHSGFGEGANWDDELDSVSAGWLFELRGLRHYLERHKNRDRHHASVQRVTSAGMTDVWSRLLGSEAFPVIDGRLAVGAHLVLSSPAGERIAGTVAWHNPGRDLVVNVGDLSDGLFRLSTWRGGGRTGLQIWLVTYDPRHQPRVDRFGEEVRLLVERLLPD